MLWVKKFIRKILLLLKLPLLYESNRKTNMLTHAPLLKNLDIFMQSREQSKQETKRKTKENEMIQITLPDVNAKMKEKPQTSRTCLKYAPKLLHIEFISIIEEYVKIMRKGYYQSL